ncbi:MAG: 30S ribosomal protein S20 [Gammaproteobacteria bacterium]|nr:30S ribosomal protein S20 [Gammaproteobacteria bacterium]
MANSPQARKRARQNISRRQRNMSQRSSLRTAIKKFLKLVNEPKKSDKSDKSDSREAAADAYREAASHIDRAVSKGLHHKNRAARLKKRLNNRLRALNT